MLHRVLCSSGVLLPRASSWQGTDAPGQKHTAGSDGAGPAIFTSPRCQPILSEVLRLQSSLPRKMSPGGQITTYSLSLALGR